MSETPYEIARRKYGSKLFMKYLYKQQDKLKIQPESNEKMFEMDDIALAIGNAVTYLQQYEDTLEKSMETANLLKNELQAEKELHKITQDGYYELVKQKDRLEERERLSAAVFRESEGMSQSLRLSLECVKGERDEYKYQLEKAEKEIKRLKELLDAASCY